MDFPIEYRDRMPAEQMAMMDALQFIEQTLICFVLLVALLILIVSLSDIVRARHSKRLPGERRRPRPRLEKIKYETEKASG
jgi:hypothetical protein